MERVEVLRGREVGRVARAEALEDAGVGLEAAVAKLRQVVEQVRVAAVHLRRRRLDQRVEHRLQVLLEIGPNCQRHVAERRKDHRFDIAVNLCVLRNVRIKWCSRVSKGNQRVRRAENTKNTCSILADVPGR